MLSTGHAQWNIKSIIVDDLAKCTEVSWDHWQHNLLAIRDILVFSTDGVNVAWNPITWSINESTDPTTCGPFYYHGLTLISAWKSNPMSSKVWDEITYPFSNFNDLPLKFGNGLDKLFHSALYNGCNVSYLSMLGLKLIHVSKKGPWWINRSTIHPSIDPSILPSISICNEWPKQKSNESICHQSVDILNKTTKQPTNQTTNQSTSQSVSQSIDSPQCTLRFALHHYPIIWREKFFAHR